MTKKIIYLLGLSVVLVSSNVMAKMYKWVDEEGNTHYSQSPPVEHSAEVIAPPPKVDTESAMKEIEKRREAFKKADEDKAKSIEEQKKADEELALKEENCRLSKARLKSLQNSRKIRAVDDEGNIVRATEEEHKARIEHSMKNVEKWCN